MTSNNLGDTAVPVAVVVNVVFRCRNYVGAVAIKHKIISFSNEGFATDASTQS